MLADFADDLAELVCHQHGSVFVAADHGMGNLEEPVMGFLKCLDGIKQGCLSGDNRIGSRATTSGLD